MAKQIYDASSLIDAIDDFSKPFRIYENTIPEHWTDFNGHMNETHYRECFSNASDGVMLLLGCDAGYIALGRSFFTVETHICHLDEAREGEFVFVTAQILKATGKKLHLFYLLYASEGEGQAERLLATGEQMLIHVDLDSRKASDPTGEVLQNMQRYGQLHQSLPLPERAGRAIG